HLSQFGDPTYAKYPDLSSVERSILEPRNPDRLRFGIWDGGLLVGSLNLTPREKPVRYDPRGEGSGSAVIGYWLGAEFQRHGYMREALTVLTDYSEKELGYRRTYAAAHSENRPSNNVLDYSGYTRIGESQDLNVYVSQTVGI